MLVVSAEDDDRRLAHGLDRLDCRVDVRSLAVVDVFDAVKLPHRLDPVLDAAESLQAVADYRNRHIHGRRGAHGAQCVLQVVGTGNKDLIRGADALLAPVHAQDDLPVPDKGSFFYFLFPAEEEHLAPDLFAQAVQSGVVRVEDRVILRRLVFEHAHLQRRIDLHRAVAVQVVLRDVRDQGHMRVERICGLHLEG